MAVRLTEQQKRWARFYVVDFNATQAAVDAGYSRSSASSRGYENSHNPLVLIYVQELKDKRNKRTDIDADYVLHRLADIDNMDFVDILDAEGCVLPVRDWPKVWRTSISSVDFGKLIKAKDDPDKLLQIIEKIKWPDTLRTLELLGKHVDVQAFNEKTSSDNTHRITKADDSEW